MVTTAQEKKSLFIPKLAELVKVEPLSEREKLFQFSLKDGSTLNQQPGQFVEVSIPGIGEAPISISSSPTRGPHFEIGVREVGNLTKALHQLKAGATVGIRGPFGNGFPVDKLKKRDLLFVAGGIGLCPLRSMIQYAVDNRKNYGRLIILYGCREPAEQLFREELAQWRQSPDIEIMESVDKCPEDITWEGTVGVITTLFPNMEINTKNTTAIVVGPPVMYKFVVAECLKKGLAHENILLSLERHMKCGLGLCGHCQINNVYVCQEGPVFSLAQLNKLMEAEI
ncbi:MAG: FAD/NAD(P)-binding protein [Chloroflexota bacterium]